jgi:ADP-ribosylglycohydrolase
MIVLNEEEYKNKVYGGWLGKNIGGTLGGPVEGKKEVLDLTFYPFLDEGGPMANDDLDLQLVWLHAIEEYGGRLTCRELGQEWLEHIFFPYDEYGYALTNLRRGLIPPVSGWFNNPFNDCMGSPIRSEIWAMLAPGAPQVAAYYAYQDAIVDHAGGEGVYGEVFFATIESAAFIMNDKEKLIDIGLSYIPDDSRTYKVVKDTKRWYGQGKGWLETRALILEHHGIEENFTDAPQNIAFTILGWLYGKDFEDAILTAVNCGYDTDCTAATLGAILGIIKGKDELPPKWVEPIGDKIVVSPPIKGFNAPYDLKELVERTVKATREILCLWDLPITISSRNKTYISPDHIHNIARPSEDHINMINRDYKTNTYLIPQGGRNLGWRIEIDYGPEGPCICKDQMKIMKFTITNNSTENFNGVLSLKVPEGFIGPKDKRVRIEAGDSIVWKCPIKSSHEVQPYYRFELIMQRHHNDNLWHDYFLAFNLVLATEWTVYGPQSKGGFKAISSGNRIEFERAICTEHKGIYRAKGTLINPKHRRVRLIVATPSPVKVKVDDEIIIYSKDITSGIPAYHRAPKDKIKDLDMRAGRYSMEIDVLKGDETLSLYVLPVAPGEVAEPGSFYYYTDIYFQ